MFRGRKKEGNTRAIYEPANFADGGAVNESCIIYQIISQFAQFGHYVIIILIIMCKEDCRTGNVMLSRDVLAYGQRANLVRLSQARLVTVEDKVSLTETLSMLYAIRLRL